MEAPCTAASVTSLLGTLGSEGLVLRGRLGSSLWHHHIRAVATSCTASSLGQKGQQASKAHGLRGWDSCMFCAVKYEDLFHLFFGCNSARKRYGLSCALKTLIYLSSLTRLVYPASSLVISTNIIKPVTKIPFQFCLGKNKHQVVKIFPE